jgi:glutathione S-transferase
MRLLYAPASPYSAKVRMMAHALKLDVKAEKVDTASEPGILMSSNPLGKIPVLLLKDGQAVYDSRVIMQVFDQLSGGSVFPGDDAAKTKALVLEATADGINDCLLAIVYERRFHPPEKIHEPWIDRHKAKVVRSLDHLNSVDLAINTGITGGHCAVAAMLGYLDLRFPGEFPGDRPNLAAFVQDFEKSFPDYSAMKPQ